MGNVLGFWLVHYLIVTCQMCGGVVFRRRQNVVFAWGAIRTRADPDATHVIGTCDACQRHTSIFQTYTSNNTMRPFR